MNREQPYPKRRNVRLSSYDYSQPGAYFITICTHGGRCLFGDIVDWQVSLNAVGDAIKEEFLRSFEIRKEMSPDAWVIMPNHLHAIVVISEVASALRFDSGDLPVAPTGALKRPGPRQRSISSLVGGFKAAATRRVRQRDGAQRRRIWQRNYYEHVIRNEREFERLRDYTIGNPSRWFEDSLHPENLPRLKDERPENEEDDS